MRRHGSTAAETDLREHTANTQQRKHITHFGGWSDNKQRTCQVSGLLSY